MIFPGVVYECESWTINKAENQRNWCFQIDAFGAEEDSWMSLGQQRDQTS